MEIIATVCTLITDVARTPDVVLAVRAPGWSFEVPQAILVVTD